MTYKEADKIQELIDSAKSILIIQADNPDSDSLGSALAMETLLGNQNKEIFLYCGVDMPNYIKYLDGWDRVEKNFPNNFDLSILVDVSTMTLFEHLEPSMIKKLYDKPSIVLDHHKISDNPIKFADVTINDPTRSSAGELIFLIGKQLNWKMDQVVLDLVTGTILGDTQGLSNQLASANTYKIMSELIESGVDRPKLEEKRREFNKMPLEIFKYKAKLLARSEFIFNNRIACITIPQQEINTYSPLYNPSVLVQGDMLQTVGVEIAIAFKTYNDGRITASIRCNPSASVASKLAQHFGGGGHDYASGFKVTDQQFDKLKNECLKEAQKLLRELDNENS